MAINITNKTCVVALLYMDDMYQKMRPRRAEVVGYWQRRRQSCHGSSLIILVYVGNFERSCALNGTLSLSPSGAAARPPPPPAARKAKKKEELFALNLERRRREREWVFEHGQPTYSPDKAQF